MKRYNIPGHVHFVTTRTFSGTPYFKDDVCCRIFLEEIEFYRYRYIFKVLGYVVMTNHIHLLILPEGGYDISNIMKSIKVMTTKRIKRYMLYDRYLGNWEDTMNNKMGNSGDALGSLGDVTQATRDAVRATRSQKISQSLRVWQNGFYDFNVYSEKKLIEKLNYIHNNPVKHGHVKNPEDWEYSSWRNYYQDDDSVMIIDKID